MKHHSYLTIPCAFLVGIVASAHAQDLARIQAERIIDQYVKAAGGARTLARIQTLSLQGTVTASGEGNSGTYTTQSSQTATT